MGFFKHGSTTAKRQTTGWAIVVILRVVVTTTLAVQALWPRPLAAEAVAPRAPGDVVIVTAPS